MARPDAPPGFDFANFHGQEHIPTTLPPEIDLPTPAVIPTEHIPDVVLPDQALDHMSLTAAGHVPEWLLS
jgi:hypothetical protein